MLSTPLSKKMHGCARSASLCRQVNIQLLAPLTCIELAAFQSNFGPQREGQGEATNRARAKMRKPVRFHDVPRPKFQQSPPFQIHHVWRRITPSRFSLRPRWSWWCCSCMQPANGASEWQTPTQRGPGDASRQTRHQLLIHEM